MDGFSVFPIFIHIEQTVWSSSELLPFPGGKRFLSAKQSMPDWAALQFLRSVLWFLRILIIFWKTATTKSSMAASLDGADLSAPCDQVTLTDDIPDIWIESLFDLKGTINPVHRAVVPSMYHAIVKDTVCASIWSNGKIIATGLGILDRNYIGLYAIHVREDFRHKGYARQICTALLKEGKKKGATKAYLQVVEGNTPARNLYESLGLHYLYTYWFRVQTHTN